MSKPKIAIIGLGRLGGSIGLGLKKANIDATLVGHDKDGNTAGRAMKRGAVDKTEWNLISACEGAGLIVLALPLDGIAPTLAALSKYLEPEQIITDTAPSKTSVLEAANLLPTSVHFIGGDPIINAARIRMDASGIDAADAGLFADALYCLTPGATATEAAVQTVTGMVALLGAKPFFLDAFEHDALISGVRHLALVLSAALMKSAAASGSYRDLAQMAGAEFYRATELLSGMPSTHAQTLLAHRDSLLHWIDTSVAALDELRVQIDQKDAKGLEKTFDELNRSREAWLKGEVSKPPAFDYSEVQLNPARFLLGGLVDRKPKKAN